MATGAGLGELPEVADRVLTVVEQIPAGRVASYGDIAAVAGIGPRQVGQVMSEFGFLVSWWRVVRADGQPPQGHLEEALARYRQEETPMRRPDRVDLTRARHRLEALSLPAERADPTGLGAD